ncbi:hypothetical protein K8I31_10985, partial [bacterium]|nr:hypothetical protein [bacterium]
MNGRERILAMLSGKKPDHLPLMPITMMYAADQINRPYGEYARDHNVLVEAQIATTERFEFDYVSVISDPAREAADLGAEVEYFDNQPPALNEQRALLHEKSRLNDLEFLDPKKGRLNDRVQGVAQFKKRVGKKYFIEGWVEGPCAQASDLRGINALMMDFYDDPEFVNALFDFVIEMELIFAVAQIEVGADIIG